MNEMLKELRKQAVEARRRATMTSDVVRGSLESIPVLLDLIEVFIEERKHRLSDLGGGSWKDLETFTKKSKFLNNEIARHIEYVDHRLRARLSPQPTDSPHAKRD